MEIEYTIIYSPLIVLNLKCSYLSYCDQSATKIISIERAIVSLKKFQNFEHLLNPFTLNTLSGADPGFFLGGGAPPRNGVADW